MQDHTHAPTAQKSTGANTYMSLYMYNTMLAKIEGTKYAVFFIFSTWFCALMISVPPLLGWSEYVPENSGLT